jgi:hypothetical protein
MCHFLIGLFLTYCYIFMKKRCYCNKNPVLLHGIFLVYTLL